jgi:hypothetical protein
MSIYGLDRPSIREFPKLTGRKETPNSTTRRGTAALDDQIDLLADENLSLLDKVFAAATQMILEKTLELC